MCAEITKSGTVRRERRHRLLSLSPRGKFVAICAFIVFTNKATDVGAQDIGKIFEIPISTARDAGFNKIIRSPSSGQSASGLNSSSVANSIAIVQSGRGNTIILTVDQKNSGTVLSAGSLNGTLNLD
jgi:hypothetical protein